MTIYATGLVAAVFLPVFLYLRESGSRGWAHTTVSHFWYFSFLFLIAFPLRAFLLESEAVSSQLRNLGSYQEPSAPLLGTSLLLATALWLSCYAGYRSAMRKTSTMPVASTAGHDGSDTPDPTRRPAIVFAVTLIVGAIALLYINPDWRTLNGAKYLSARSGSGFLWLLPELSIYAFIGLLASALCANLGQRQRMLIVALLLTGAAAITWIGVELQTRRLLAACILSVILAAAIRFPRLWPLCGLGIVGTAFASPILEILRHINRVFEESRDIVAAAAERFQSAVLDSYLATLSTGFEGAEHLANFLAKASARDLFIGIDHGVSWAFNAGLGFVPRALWSTKPTIYGSFSQFEWLYPDSVVDGAPLLAVPPSFPVDLLFGFGLVGGVVFAFLFGRLFAVFQACLTAQGRSPVLVALSIFGFVLVFNFVRSGTAYLQGLLMMGAVCMLMFGIGTTVSAAKDLLSATLRFGRVR